MKYQKFARICVEEQGIILSLYSRVLQNDASSCIIRIQIEAGRLRPYVWPSVGLPQSVNIQQCSTINLYNCFPLIMIKNCNILVFDPKCVQFTRCYRYMHTYVLLYVIMYIIQCVSMMFLNLSNFHGCSL